MAADSDDSDEPYDYDAIARALLPGVIESLGHIRLRSLSILISEIAPQLSFFSRVEAQRRLSELTTSDLAQLNEAQTRAAFTRILGPLYAEIGRAVDFDSFEIYPDPGA